MMFLHDLSLDPLTGSDARNQKTTGRELCRKNTRCSAVKSYPFN